MSARTDAYAQAMFLVAKAEGVLSTVEDELFRVARTLEANEQLRAALSDQSLPVDLRQGIVEDLLSGKASTLTTNLVGFVVGTGRGKDLPAIIDALVTRAAADRSQAVAEVRSAINLDGDQQARLATALGHATGKTVSIKVIVDPSILGGIIARVGDTVIDGSVRHRLEQLKETL